MAGRGEQISFTHNRIGAAVLTGLPMGSVLGRGGKFNVDSPAFTPSTPPKNLITPKAAGAPPFTPKGEYYLSIQSTSGACRVNIARLIRSGNHTDTASVSRQHGVRTILRYEIRSF